MTISRTILASAAGLVLLGGVAGFTLKGCITPKPRTETIVERDTTRYDVDSIRAEILGELEGRPATIITRRVEVPVPVRDAEADRLALELYTRIDSLIVANDSIRDIVATGYVKTDTYELSQAYSLRRREFAHVLHIMHSDTNRTVTCPDPPSFWDHIRNYGLAGAVGAILGILLTSIR